MRSYTDSCCHSATPIFAGVTTEVCVQTTLRDANDWGYDCPLVENATASYFPVFKQDTLEIIMTAQGGMIGWGSPVVQVLQTLRSHRPLLADLPAPN